MKIVKTMIIDSTYYLIRLVKCLIFNFLPKKSIKPLKNAFVLWELDMCYRTI